MRQPPPHFTTCSPAGYYDFGLLTLHEVICSMPTLCRIEETLRHLQSGDPRSLYQNVHLDRGPRASRLTVISSRISRPNCRRDALLKSAGFAYAGGMIDLHTAGHRRASSRPHAAAPKPAAPRLGRAATRSKHVGEAARASRRLIPMNHLGGGRFWLVRGAEAACRAIMAAGPALARSHASLYLQHERSRRGGALAALTCPRAAG